MLKDVEQSSSNVNVLDRKTLGQASRITQTLTNSQAECDIEVMGVIHDWSPGIKLLDKVGDADILTLELTRNVVKEGLLGERGRILKGNPFWRGLINGVRENQEGKIIRGVEINQTVRNGWKRLALHNGDNTLAAALHTIEVDRAAVEQLSNLLDQEQRDSLLKYSWLMVDDVRVAYPVLMHVNELLKELSAPIALPLSLGEGFSLVAASIDVPKNRRFLTTFMLPPHPSVLEAEQKVQEELKTTPIELTEKETRVLTMTAVESFFLSHAELKDAEEMIYALNQFVRRGLSREQKIHQIHIGGAAHARAISSILREYFSGNSQNIEIIETYDPRFGVYQGEANSFFSEQIPFNRLVEAVSVEGFEVMADPQKIATEVRASIDANPEDFRKRILVRRILFKKPYERDTRETYSYLYKYRNKLYDKDIEELEAVLAN